MKTEVVFNGENELMDAFELLLQKHNVEVKVSDVVKASETLPPRRSNACVGKVLGIAKATLELLNKSRETEAEIQLGETVKIITHQTPEGEAERIISSHKGLRVVFKRKSE